VTGAGFDQSTTRTLTGYRVGTCASDTSVAATSIVARAAAARLPGTATHTAIRKALPY
jgi:hypothetical protein